MDIFSMLQNATIVDAHTGEGIGQTVGFEVANGRMRLKTVMFIEYDSEDDDDPGEEDIPEPEDLPVDANGRVESVIRQLHVVAGGEGDA